MFLYNHVHCFSIVIKIHLIYFLRCFIYLFFFF